MATIAITSGLQRIPTQTEVVVITNSASFTMFSTPTFDDGTALAQRFQLMGGHGMAGSIILQQDHPDGLMGSKLILGGYAAESGTLTRTVSAYAILNFVWNGTVWVESTHNLP